MAVQHIYAASHGERGMISHLTLDEEGQLSLRHFSVTGCADYLTIEGSQLYVLLREPYMMQSGVQCYELMPSGFFLEKGPPVPTRGSVAAYVLRHAGYTYVSNYLQGTTIRLPDRMIVHQGSSVHPTRQNCSHPHCIVKVPHTDYLAIADLGTDKIYLVDQELNPVSEVNMPTGSGPRHLAFHPTLPLAYCVSELSSTVSVLRIERNRLQFLRSYSTLPADYTGVSTGSAIKIDESGTHLFVSNRGHDSVAVFYISNDQLILSYHLPSGGRSPRDILLTGPWLLCANEGSDNIQVFRVGDPSGQSVCTLSLPCPWCIQLQQSNTAL